MKPIVYLCGITLLLASCNMNSNNTSSENDNMAKNEAMMQRFYDCVNKHDMSKIDSLVAPTWIEHQTMSGKSSTYTVDSLKRDMKGFITMYPDINVKVNYMIADSNTVMAQWIQSGTNSGATFWGAPATNKPVTVEGVDIIKFDKDHRAIEHWGYYDEVGEMRQLGMLPPMNSDSTMMKKDKRKK